MVGNKDTFVIKELNKEFASEILNKLDLSDSDEEFQRIIDFLDNEDSKKLNLFKL